MQVPCQKFLRTMLVLFIPMLRTRRVDVRRDANGAASRGNASRSGG